MIHEDLLAIVRLWRNEKAMEDLKQASEDAAHAVDAAEQELASALEEQAEVAIQIARLKSEERQVEAKLEVYQRRVVDTRRLIEDGRAPDYLMAVKQLAACKQIADELETSALTLMESLDEARSRHQGLERKVKETRQVRDVRLEENKALLPETEAKLGALRSERPALEKKVPLEHLETFNRLRRQGRAVLSTIKDKSCSACHYELAPQVRTEVVRNTRVHCCRYCGRFLLPAGEDE
jgi:predicted  nucleic acid-binding Zn-ribbon protein